MKKKKIILIISIIVVLLLTIGVSLAAYTYSRVGSNQELVLGDIYMHYNEGNGITLENAMPYKNTGSYIANPVMASQTYTSGGTNELSYCVDMWTSIGLSEADNGDTIENFCKGTATIQSITFQELIDQSIGNENMASSLSYMMDKGMIIENVSLDRLEYFEFTISGKNTYTQKDIWYDISLIYGDNHETRNTRIRDDLLRFTLVEIKDGVETIVVDNQSYSSIDNKRIYVNTIEKNTTSEVNITYRLYMWIDYNTVIGNVNQDYTMEEWEDVFASIKVKVTGDFNEKVVLASEEVKSQLVSYSLSSSSDFAGGLVAINRDGTLYNETDTTEEIREYRYSGAEVDNYVYFNCSDNDGTNNYGDENYDYENNCEIWRIIGVFEDENGDEVVKIVKNSEVSPTIIPRTYTVNGVSYYINADESSAVQTSNSIKGKTETTVYKANEKNKTQFLVAAVVYGVYWNYPVDYENYTDAYSNWTNAGLMYYLNTEKDDNNTGGYLSTLSSNAKDMIKESKYYLGNVKNEWDDNGDFQGDTAISSYTNERSNKVCSTGIYENSYQNENCSIWNGNQATWIGKVALMYPSDYGYSANSNYWENTEMGWYDEEAYATSWINNSVSFENNAWLLSPSSLDSYHAMYVRSDGYFIFYDTNLFSSLLPVLDLTTQTKIKTGTGGKTDPYILMG